MKTTKTTIAIAAALGLIAVGLHAQENDPQAGGMPPGGKSGHRPPPFPIISVLDVNHDHVIDAAEIANAPAALLQLDKNGDGVLATNEFLPPLPPRMAAPNMRPPHLPAIIKALDANGDEVIDAAEIANASAALLTLDKNGDGQLTPDEFDGQRPARRGRANGDRANATDDQPPGPPPGEGEGNNPPPGPPPSEQ